MSVLGVPSLPGPTGSAAYGGRQTEGKGLLRRHARPGTVPGWAHPRRRFFDELRDRRSGDETPAAQDHARKIARAQKLVDRISRDAREQLPRFFDRIEFATDHGSSIAVQGSVLAARQGPLPHGYRVITGAPNLDGRRENAKGEFLSMIVLFDGAPSRLFEGIPSSHSHTL